jgi:acyl carrier protein
MSEDSLNTEERVILITRKQLGYSDDYPLSTETNLEGDLGLDSLDAIELSMVMEEEFDIEIPDSQLKHFKTLGNIVSYITEQI